MDGWPMRLKFRSLEIFLVQRTFESFQCICLLFTILRPFGTRESIRRGHRRPHYDAESVHHKQTDATS